MTSAIVTPNNPSAPLDQSLSGSSNGRPTLGKTESSKGQKERGAAEDIIFKRLKPLNKKILRFRTYATQPITSLNADQRSALASLPALEAVSRELAEISKLVEDAELVQASKAREIREVEERELEERTLVKQDELQLALSNKLGLFLRLHSLLHPARSSDREHLTFAPLTLPLRLQDEVKATDILRVGRMYDDIIGGGVAASKVIAGLVAGPNGDEEDEHVHHLLLLLGESAGLGVDVSVEDISTAAEPAESIMEYPESEQPPSSIETPEASLLNGHDSNSTPIIELRQFEPLETPVQASLLGNHSRSKVLNFLQEDELEGTSTEFVEEGYEVIEAPPSIPDIVQPAFDESLTRTPIPVFSAGLAPIDWTAEEDDTDDVDEAARIRDAFSSSGAVTPAADEIKETTVTVADEPPVIALVQPIDVASDAIPAAEVPTAVEADVTGPNVARAPRKQNRKPSSRQKSSEDRATSGQERKPRVPQPVTVVDEDGFEMKVRRPTGPVSRGRGGSRGTGDRGRGSGRGRGGAPREIRPNGATKDSKVATGSSGSRPVKDGEKSKDKVPVNAEPRERKPSAPKPSIYKTMQPTGPTSAPIF